MATLTQIQALVTKTAAFDGASLSIAVLGTSWSLVLEVQATGPDTIARLQFSDSVDAFTTTVAGPTFVAPGGLAAKNSKRFAIKSYDFPDLRFGVSSAVLRLSLTRITGTSQTVTYQAWLEQ